MRRGEHPRAEQLDPPIGVLRRRTATVEVNVPRTGFPPGGSEIRSTRRSG